MLASKHLATIGFFILFISPALAAPGKGSELPTKSQNVGAGDKPATSASRDFPPAFCRQCSFPCNAYCCPDNAVYCVFSGGNCYCAF
ncbi:MAG: hypothetical protein BYD32DRAFT_423908 [Podila humilis]|nr:MAG: hypothetical protein BYD32DRAFT_423908 [Podila humilis]